MRIAVLGAAGQLGSDLCPRLPGEVVKLARAEIDLARPRTVPSTLAKLHLDVLINCAAYNFVDRAEDEPDAAFAVNAQGVRALARACRATGVRLVHFSTDYVFGLDHSRETPLSEDDRPGPVSVYGMSKLAGEYFALAEHSGALVIRTCGLYGASGSGGKGTNFVETMLRLAEHGSELRVVNDQRCTPSSTVDIALGTAELIRRGATGLFHLTNSGSCTWYEFAGEIFRLSGLKPSLIPIPSSESGRVARRPTYSVLSSAKLLQMGIPQPRLWSEALADYLAKR